MTSYEYGMLLSFGVIIYIIVVDPNVSEYLSLLVKMLKIKTERIYWMVRLHPKNPITNLMMKIKYDRIAKELQKELNDKLSDSN